uniref:Protein translocase subunit SecA n=1 Tax=Diacronema lutheri TaxID=2081491 RepID=SECA_DIALT|nr:RecName: Full=Protein translocase subunit SecA [Diacronema lutheri]CAA46776.1 secretory protein for transport of proteins across membranes [Diacronema lutheri]
MLKDILRKTTQSDLYRYENIVKKINDLERVMKPLTNEELRAKTLGFRKSIEDGQSIDNILPEAFGLVREASLRILGLRHYDVQLIGGCILHDSKIAEMKTGEGKTLVAILPAYLNALSGKSVHIVTVNEYLAKRDSLSVGRVLSFLGLSVGLILADMNREERQENYKCDVIYTTNSELGFDYLRDNLVGNPSEKVQNGFEFAIIDEVDSVLIDEARTPLIISRSLETLNNIYLTAKNVAQAFEINTHYEIDKRNRNVYLNESGSKLAEKLLGVSSIYKFETGTYILNAIKAKEFYTKDKDYLVMRNQITIVDEFTGRILKGRRWGDGLHQAIEAKEGVTVGSETMTMASITYQNFFLFYKKLSGMTGTALTEAKEFKKIYNLSVDCVPINKKVNRIDKEDVVYKSLYAKWKAVLYESLSIHEQGRPLLIGTSNVKNSEIVSGLLKEYNIKHSLLNAKPENAANESEIIAQAGRKGSVTIATNMAGRGTDILLGGNPDFLTKGELRYIFRSIVLSLDDMTVPKNELINNLKYKYVISEKNRLDVEELIDKLKSAYTVPEKNRIGVEELIENIDESFQPVDKFEILIQKLYEKTKERYVRECLAEKEEVIQLGGLHIIGTEKHDSRRIDNQLRGRAGRQGDPGSSKFFLSFEDRLIEIFTTGGLKNMIKELDLEDDQPVEGKIVSLSIESAQKRIEDKNYQVRKQLFNYDNVLNLQRKVIYDERDRFLSLTDFKGLILQYLEKLVDDVVAEMERSENQEDKSRGIVLFCKKFICLPYSIDPELLSNLSKEEIKIFLNDQVKISYELKEIELESLRVGLSQSLEYAFLLQSIDQVWKEQLTRMELLKESIGWRAYGQRDPLLEYQKEAYRIFAIQTRKIRHSASHLIMCSTSFA